MNKPHDSLVTADPLSPELSEWDSQLFKSLISTNLSPEQQKRIVKPERIHTRQEMVLAVHWHPEFVPLDLIRARLAAMFPSRRREMIIPTQHNVLMSYDDFAGVEVDCFSGSFNRKVQLLIHFHAAKVEGADAFRAMLAHTFRYRSRQLQELLETILEPAYEERMQQAADQAGADEDLVAFLRAQTRKLRRMLDEHGSAVPAEAIRNKLLLHYIQSMRDRLDEHVINHALTLLRAVKELVKANFSNEHYYATEEFIEEVRSLGGGIIIPHPEQFWPILLADYDVDGYEVWNPQSREFTEFLIQAVTRQNKGRRRGRRELLISMGDDCHMGEKARDPQFQDPEKVGRQIGVQPPWDDPAMHKTLVMANASRQRFMDEYAARLIG